MIMQSLKTFISRQLSLAALLALVSWYFFSKLGPQQQTLAWPYLLVFFVAVNTLLFWLNQRAQQKRMSAYANYFMLASMLKLLLYLAVIVVYLIYVREETIPFLISFFVYYLAFTVLEVTSVARKKQKNNQNQAL